MPSTYDPLLRLELQATGENATTWGTKTNNNLDLIAAAIAGQAVVTVSSVDVTLTEANAAPDQARAGILVLTGTLTNNVNVIVPPASKTYAVFRQTSGAFNLTVKNATGSGTVLPATGTDLVVCTTATCVGLVGNIAAAVSALDTRIAAVSASISAANVQIAAVSSQVSVVGVQIAAVSAQVSTLGVQIAAVSAQTSVLGTQIASVSAQVSVVGAQAAAVSSQVSVVAAQLASVSAQVSVINALNIRIIE